MTNEQIIANIAMSIYGEDVVNELIESGKDIPLHTVQGWASRGPYRVKKGEHGIETKLWKKKQEQVLKKECAENTSTVSADPDFYLCKSFLFRADQVEWVDRN